LKKKNILIISPPLKLIGGTEKQVKVVAKNLVKRGHRVTISEKRLSFFKKFDEVHIWRADAIITLILMKIMGTKVIYMIRDSMPFKYMKIRYVLVLLSSYFADMIYTNSINAIINYKLFKKNNIKVILNEEYNNDS